ncbi:outer membrane protein [Brevundimonas sp. R86498]|uniref:outer membrane protein n=1 Tax=Brevundimonas sp. R86498 TaxID=3093845 RepID=UPI0037CACB95
MTKTLAALGVSVLALAAAAPAAAQDWQGPYLGGFTGYVAPAQQDDETILFDTNLDGSFGDTVRTTAGADAFSPGFCGGNPRGNNAAAGCSEDDDGAGEVGLRAGYDLQFGSWVVGGVADLGLTNVEDAVTGFSTTPASYTFEREIKGMAAARLRVGYAMGRYLPYVTAGYALADVEDTYVSSNVANSFTPVRRDTDADGYQLGAGIETRLTDSVTVGIEYLYSDLEAGDPTVVRTGQGSAPATNPFLLVNAAGTDQIRSSDQIELHAFRLTAAVRF